MKTVYGYGFLVSPLKAVTTKGFIEDEHTLEVRGKNSTAMTYFFGIQLLSFENEPVAAVAPTVLGPGYRTKTRDMIKKYKKYFPDQYYYVPTFYMISTYGQEEN